MKVPPGVRIMLLAVLPAFLALVAGCNYLPVERQSPEAAYTAGAATLIARLTQEAGQTAVAQLTGQARPTSQSGPPPKQTLAPPTAPPSETPLPPSPTAVPATPTPEPSSTPTQPAAPCNQAEFLGDISLPNDSVFPPGTLLTKVWRVRNIGSCTWNASYAVVFRDGALISPPATALPNVVAPGQIVDLAVAITVPGYAGVFQSTWMLRSDTGEVFGVGADGSVPLFTRLQAPQPTAGPASGYDFVQNYCSLSWRSGEGVLACPGVAQDPDGSIVLVQQPEVETGRASVTGLWTRPNRAANGWISGRTPALLIRSNDHFVAELACMNDGPDCNVLFQLEYSTTNGESGRLGQWRELNEGRSTLIDIDLSLLAGRSIAFTLTVFNEGRARDANAVWLQPRIQSGSTPRASTLVWTRQGARDASTCDELHIAHTATNSAIAIAYDCNGALYELGRALLNTTQLDQLQDWEDRLDNFDGEMYSASANRPVTVWLAFRGYGDVVAGNAEMQALNNLAAQIFNQIVR